MDWKEGHSPHPAMASSSYTSMRYAHNKKLFVFENYVLPPPIEGGDLRCEWLHYLHTSKKAISKRCPF